ncbi:unnamed protein product [Echinostoma caproni]|uniref:Kinesin motor domain-containing protein n=1 Tax=Echinostoma caproni TaxID=27848 RepID=A0A183A9H1_9TREM|nr:unnamed protein product [Echinostoma caproni]
MRAKDEEKTLVLVTTGESGETGATNIWFFELDPSVIYNTSQAYVDSCRGFREDVIRLMQLQVASPIIAACLWPSWDTDPSAPPFMFATDLAARRLHTYVFPKEIIKRSPQLCMSGRSLNMGANRLTTPAANAGPVSSNSVLLFGGSSFGPATASDLSIPQAQQQQPQQQSGTQSQQMIRRTSKRSRTTVGLVMRLTPTTTATNSGPEPADSGIEGQGSSCLNPMGNCNILRGIRPVRFSKVDDSNLMKIYYGDGTLELIQITPDEIHIISGLEIKGYDSLTADFEAAYYLPAELRGLVGGVHAFDNIAEINLKQPNHELNKIISEQVEALKRLPTYKPKETTSDLQKSPTRPGQMNHNSFRPLFFRSSTVMALADHSIDVSESNELSNEVLEVGPILSEPHRLTWTQECELEAQELENKVYLDAQEKLRNDLVEISTLAIQHDEPEEDEERVTDVNLVMAGSIALDYGGTDECMYGQMELYTREQKIYQIVLIQDNIFRIKEAFNKQFNEVYEKKESGLSRIRSRLARVRKVLIDLQQPSSARVIFDPQFTPEEQPEQLLTVHDAEITVEKYLSPAQIAELEAKKMAEEERKRREKLDNWRERGLEEMMGGVLEVRKEDELKKDVPKPAFLLTGKPLGHWTEDDKRLYAEYERKVKELNEEREKYRKFLEADVKKMYAQIDDEKSKFDEQLLALFQYWIRVQMAVLQEELKVWRLKWMLLIEEELFVHEYELHGLLDKAECEIEQMKNTLEASKKVLDDMQQLYEIQCAEDRLMEKNFRKDFSDVHGPLYDYILKAFRRRPRRMVPTGSAHNPDLETSEGIRSHGQPGSTIFNPYVEKPSHKRIPTDSKTLVEECLKELDNDPAHESQPGMENTLWERLCRTRKRKLEKEMEIKATALNLAEINAFKREEELEKLTEKRDGISTQLKNLLIDYHRDQTDLELQLLTKQGQVELEVAEGEMVHDFSDALLIDRQRVEALNKHIIMLGESKVAHMIKNKEFKKRFYHLEWELRQMLMQYEDLQAKQADIRKFKITREVQKYLEISDYDGLINAQIMTIEQTINLQRQLFLNILHSRYSSGCADLQKVNRMSRCKLLVQQQRLMQLAREQSRELQMLRAEAARARREHNSSSLLS